MAKPKTDELFGLESYRAGLASFVGELDRAEEAGKFNDPKHFASLLDYALSSFKLAASDLALEEEISKSAISKWKDGLALPSPPTRKTVINWIKRKTHEQLEQLGK